MERFFDLAMCILSDAALETLMKRMEHLKDEEPSEIPRALIENSNINYNNNK